VEYGLEVTVYWETPVYQDEESRDVLRVVSYGTDEPHLERRAFYRTRDSRGWVTGKARGITRMDLEVILSRVAEIAKAFRRETVGQ
jgi:hypothetical protein